MASMFNTAELSVLKCVNCSFIGLDLETWQYPYSERPLHNLVKIAIFCNLWNNNLANSSTMTLGITVLNQEVHENVVETSISGCRKSG